MDQEQEYDGAPINKHDLPCKVCVTSEILHDTWESFSIRSDLVWHDSLTVSFEEEQSNSLVQ